jgi:hypothetical protein
METRVLGLWPIAAPRLVPFWGLLLDNVVQNWNSGMDLMLDKTIILD